MSTPPPIDDTERTVMPERVPGDGAKSTGKSPPQAGPHALPAGTRLGEFEVTGFIGEGGFSLVYLGYDHSLQRTVAIKEYMPAALAARLTDTTVGVKSDRHADTFKLGLKSFVNEARLLAQFDHPSLIKVYRFWEANGTAYMVMPYYEGPTLKQALAQRSKPPDQKWLEALLRPLLDALEVLHNAQCYHRDIAPDNILLLRGDQPLLLDFGAARRVIGDMSQTLTVIVKAGYAPLEQYAEDPSMRQGAWTDLYALSSVVYFAITGHAPVPALSRMRVDQLVPLSKCAAGRYSRDFLRAIDSALALEPEKRPQSVAEFRRLLGFAGSPGSAEAIIEDASQGLPVVGADGAVPVETQSRRGLWAIAGAIVVLVIVAGVLVWRPWEGATPLDATTAALPQAPNASVSALPSQASAPAPAPSSASTAAAPPAPPAVGARGPYDPLTALSEVYAGRDPTFDVTVDVEKALLRIKQDNLRLRVTSAREGYVYMLVAGDIPNAPFLLLFPNSVDRDNRIAAGATLDLPRPAWAKYMHATGPPGTDRHVVLVSDLPRDFSGLKSVEAEIFRRFPRQQAARQYESYTGQTPLFSGKPTCPASQGSDCSSAYGAFEFSIEQVDG